MDESKKEKSENSANKGLVVVVLTPYEERLVRHIAYLRRYTLGEFFREAIEHLFKHRAQYRPDSSLFCDKGIYHTYGLKTHSIKLTVGIGVEARLSLDLLSEEDDRDLRTIMRTVVAEYLNHLHSTGDLGLYTASLAKTPFVE